ncbi:BZ3500_MvSof-1268-A1-R1_Chr3-1g05593 [Microbotryum saponariae]|uniref:BZ3500_MvSof-1268-A1-R1_Chr3-1g05593 protein n=1 Tax=Microbotryum saponariae TaxID=289078 RepID=A0A2X0LZ71_9BASI|nr:BZ3500_MvSof-1268-A1-R1_Chr3-1g05593 [Microbotryum saponariae]SDA04783.1 BZ3501_MvSof-1269-A2-R1_Chr3-1g05263 [Microbotryum saponariae]
MPTSRNPTSQQTIADHRAKLRTTTELLMRNVEFPLAQSTVGRVDASKFEVGLAPWDAPVDWPRIDPRIEGK